VTILLGTETLTRRRYGAQSIDGATGRPASNTPTDTVFVGSVQPASDDDMQTLPEGERAREGLRIYATTALRVADESSGLPADEVVRGAVVYQVRRLQRYGHLLDHYRAIVVRRPPQVTGP